MGNILKPKKVVKKKGRPSLFEVAMTGAERAKRFRDKQREEKLAEKRKRQV